MLRAILSQPSRRSQMLPPSLRRHSGISRLNTSRWKRSEICVEQHDFEARIECEEGPQSVGLAPYAAFGDPCLGVLEGIEDVVKVHVNSGAKPRHYFPSRKFTSLPIFTT